MTSNSFLVALYITAGVMGIVLMILLAVYFNMKVNDKKGEKTKSQEAEGTEKKTLTKQYTVGSVFDFMEFEKIEDNMIVQKNGTKYIMVIECQGINYDLMSEPEKVGVEEGFIQFLNVLSGPIQIYTQTRTINLENSIQTYKDRVNEIENAYNKQNIKYQQLVKSGQASEEQLKKEYYELVKQRNLCEYGKDIIYNTEKMSLNKNILSKKYYVAISYYTAELGQNNFDKTEIKELAFSELYTKAQALIRALSTSGVMGKIMSSTDLLDLLYVAYNRDDAEIYGVDKAMRARYDELYSTAPDYMDKKTKLLDEEIAKQAYQKANEKVIEAQSEKQKRYKEKQDNIDTIIDNLAALIIEENASTIGRETADAAKEKITVDKKRKERNKNVQQKTETTRRISSSTK
jgi:hypothetical protein